MKKGLKIIIGAVLVIIILAAGILTYIVGKGVFDGATNLTSREETVKNMKLYQNEYEAFIKKYNIDKYEVNHVASQVDGHGIPILSVENENTNNYAVLIHGLGGTKELVTDVMEIFIDLGYNVVSYDQRNSGTNMEEYNTFGVLESLDARDVVSYARDMTKDGQVVLWGESYGGATAAMALGRDEKNIDFLILDSSVSDSNELMKPYIEKYSKEYNIPYDYMLWAGSLYTKGKLGFSFKDINVADSLKETTRPVLIISGDNDALTPPSMAQELYEAVPHDDKELYTAKGYGHCDFIKKDPKSYEEVIKSFLMKYAVK